MAHDVNYNRPPYAKIYEHVAPWLLSDDLSFGNLEFPCDPDKPLSNFPFFNVHPSYIEAAIYGGFDIFSLANNHIADQGKISVEKTLDVMSELKKIYPILYSGLRETPNEEFFPESVTLDQGCRIGFLAVTAFLNCYTGKEYVHFVPYRSREKREEFLQILRDMTDDFDLFILSFHGGREYALSPIPEKKDFFHDCLNAGADIIWAHHPHVLQPVERVWQGGSVKLIIYSAGNFISGQIWSIDPEHPDPERVFTGDSALFQVVVEQKRAGDAEASIRSVKPMLISNYRDPEYGMTVIPTKELLKKDIPREWTAYYARRADEIKTKIFPKIRTDIPHP